MYIFPDVQEKYSIASYELGEQKTEKILQPLAEQFINC